MIRFDFISLVVIFIVIPRDAHSLFTDSVLHIINSTGNLSCYMTSTSINDSYHLCAIRTYSYLIDGDMSQTTNVWDGIWFTNTFRQLIRTRSCTGFNNDIDIGSGKCEPMPYEIVQTMTLCICATTNCNENLETCQTSNNENPNTPPLPNTISDLATVIQCANTSEYNFTCFPSIGNRSFINSSACEAYVSTHSVLCTIINDGTDVPTQEAFIEENYQSYLTSRLYLLQFMSQQMSINAPDQTSTSIYVTYSVNEHTYQECGCTQSSFCNYNISTCSSNIIQTQTTNSAELAATSVTDFTTEFPPTVVVHSTVELATETSAIITDGVTYIPVTSSVSGSTSVSTSAIIAIAVGVALGSFIILSLVFYKRVYSGNFHRSSHRANVYQV